MAIYRNIKEKTKNISLPDLVDSKIEIYEDITYGDAEGVFAKGGNDMEKSIDILLVSIKDWNLTDEQGVKLPITKETIRNFKASDVLFLVDFLLERLKMDKKSEADLEDTKKKVSKK